MGDKGTIKVVLRKSDLGVKAQSIDLKSIREIIKKTQRKQSLFKLGLTPIQKKTTGGNVVEPKSGQVAPFSEKPGQEGAKPNFQDNEHDKLALNDLVETAAKKQRNYDAMHSEESQSYDAFDSDGQLKTEYSCCFCQYMTKSDDDYRKHISSHIKNKALRCTLCSFSADKITTYNEHIKEVHGRNSPLKTAYVCSVCSYKCLTIERLLKHKAAMGHCEKAKSFQECKICGMSDSNVYKLLQHVINHSREANDCQLCLNPDRSSFRCHNDDCPEVVSPVAHQYEELLEPLPKKNFTCTLCDFQCKELLFLLEHIKAHARRKLITAGTMDDVKEADYPFCCTMCDYRCVRPSKLASHMTTHARAAVFQCKDCTFESKDLAYFRAHRKIHVENQGFTCFVCLTKFTSHDSLKTHMTTHWKTKPFACDFCEYKCITKTRLLMHMKSHSKKKTQVLFPCPLCANKYSTSASLRNHLRTHNTDGKPYQCDFCDYTCFTSELLRVHVLKHSTGANKTRCEICFRNFPTEIALNAHMSVHGGIINRERCRICNRCFTTKAQLASHISLHLGHKSTVCQFCNAKFPDNMALQAHVRFVHNNPDDEEENSSQDASYAARTKDEKEAISNSDSIEKQKYGFVEEDIGEESGSDGEEMHLGQHQLIGYPEMVTE